jgi:hypothetical protein
LQAEYDTVTVNLTKSGNHDSSFTRVAKLSLNQTDGEDSQQSISILKDDDVNEGDDDEFGMDGGGWCCFTNSLPIVYICMWLNKKTSLTSFVGGQIPADVQCDSAKADGNQTKWKASDTISKVQKKIISKKITIGSTCRCFAGFVKDKEAEAASQWSRFTESLGLELQSFLKTQSSKEATDPLFCWKNKWL